MSTLRIKLKRGVLVENYQSGMQRLLEVPVHFGSDIPTDVSREFFAYLSTLGGGLVGGDVYKQSFNIVDTKAVLQSQSSQKIYKGESTLVTRIEIDDDTELVYHNDANIFYKDAKFNSKTTVFAGSKSRLFYLDGGFLGYAGGEFLANMGFRLYIDSKLMLNDTFSYSARVSLNALYKHEYFYTVVMRGAPEIKTFHEKGLKLHTSTVCDTTIIRILADDNDIAMNYINEIKESFLKN